MKFFYLIIGLFIFSGLAQAITINPHQINNASRPTPYILYKFNSPPDINVSASYFDELNFCNITTASGGGGGKGGLYPVTTDLDGNSLFVNNFLGAFNPYLETIAGTAGCPANFTNFNFSQSGTIDFYLKTNSTLQSISANPQYLFRDNTGHFAIQSTSGNSGFRVQMSSPADGGLCIFSNAGNVFSISDNDIHRFTFSWFNSNTSNSNTNGTFYLDGEYNSSVLCKNTLRNNGTRFNIGGLSTAVNGFDGLIDEFAIYSANYSPQRIDGQALNCFDGTANNTCSSLNKGYYCDGSTGSLSLDLNACPCSITEFFNGTACVASNTVQQTKLPVDLYIYDLGICFSGQDCPIFGIIPSDLLQVKYLVNKKLIGNASLLGTDTNIVLANNATCKLVDLNPDLTPTGFERQLDFNKDKQVWENTGGNTGFNGKIISIECKSEIQNTNVYSYFNVGNTRLGKDIYAVSSSGTTGRLDNKITDRENPVIYQLQTSAQYRPSSDTCALDLTGTEFNSQNGESFSSGYIFNQGDLILWKKNVNNIINTSGEYQYNWTCVNSPTSNNFGLRFPAIKLLNSLVATQTCASADSTSLSVIYSYSQGTETNVSNKFYYGTDIIPIIKYNLRNSPSLIQNAECSLSVLNGTDELKKQTFNFVDGILTDSTNGLSVPQVDINYFPLLTNNQLYVGNYSFLYTCKNKDLGVCISPAILNQSVEILATNGTGTSESCGISTAINCGYSLTTCEIGSRNIQKSCVNQECRINRVNECLECKKAGQEIYGLNMKMDSNLICGKDLKVNTQTTNIGSPFNTNTTFCISNIRNNLGEVLNVHNIGITDGINFNTTFGNLPCGENLTVTTECYSENTCPPSKVISKVVQIGQDIKCNYNSNQSGQIKQLSKIRISVVSQGCVSDSTGFDSDKPYFCNIDGSIGINKICGCPLGKEFTNDLTKYESNKLFNGCVSNNPLNKITDYVVGWKFINIWSIGLLFFISIIFLLWVKWKEATRR